MDDIIYSGYRYYKNEYMRYYLLAWYILVQFAIDNYRNGLEIKFYREKTTSEFRIRELSKNFVLYEFK